MLGTAVGMAVGPTNTSRVLSAPSQGPLHTNEFDKLIFSEMGRVFSKSIIFDVNNS